jgi:hypothetical protein
MKPGIYINLPEDEYHAIDALGSTSIKELADDPVEFQYKRLLEEEDPETQSKILGSAIHKRLLEGRAAFEASHYCKLDPSVYVKDGALVTVEDLKQWLRNNGLNVSGKKDDLKQRVREADPSQMILDDIVEEHRAKNEGKIELNHKQWERVNAAAEWCQMDELVGPFMQDGTFTLGLNEVSVVAEIDGVPVKARFDVLANHMILDLKSFQPFLNKQPIMAIPYHIRKMGYVLQAGHYLNVWQEAKLLAQKGLIFGSYPDGFFDKVFSRERPTWTWLFLKTTGAPQPYVRELSFDSMVYHRCQQDAKEAILFYRQKVSKYGLDQLWPPENRAISLGDEELL